MRKITKIVISASIIMSSVLSPVSNNVFSAPGDSYVDARTSKWVFTTKLSELNKSLQNNYRGQFGLLYNLYFLTEQMMWTHAAVTTRSLAYSDFEKKELLNSLSVNIKNFNSLFNEAASKESPLPFSPLLVELTNGETNGSVDINSIVVDNLTGIETNLGTRGKISAYLKVVLDHVKSVVDKAGDDAAGVKKAVEENKEQLRYIYRILDTMSNGSVYMSSLLEPIDDNGSYGLVVVQDALNLLNSADYKDILNHGRDLAKEAANTSGNVDVKSDVPYIETLSHMSRKASADPSDDSPSAYESTSSDKKIKLTTTYAAFLAASATYVPFNSVLGDKPFMDALKGISGDKFPEIEKIYNDLKARKKPLYMASDQDFVSGKSFNGTANMLNVQDFNDAVLAMKSMVIFTGKSQFGPLPDTNEFGFYRHKGYADQIKLESERNKQGSSAPVQNASQASPSPTSSSVPNVVGSGAQTQVVSSSVTHVVPAQEKMTSNNNTLPIMGFSKSWTDKIEIALLTNIFVTYKKQITDTSKTDFLFINPFGDIVTADDRVIIPGVANPAIFNSGGYPVYNAAWMNTYPTIRANGSTGFKVDSEDKGKFVTLSQVEKSGGKDAPKNYFLRMKSETDAAYIADANSTSTALINRFYGINNGGAPSVLFDQSRYNLDFNWLQRLGNFFVTSIDNDAYTMEVVSQLLPATNYHIFPYNSSKDPEGITARLIGQNMFHALTNVNGEITNTLNEVLAQEFIFNNILVEGLNGSVYTSTFRKNIVQDYEKAVADEYLGLKKLISNLTKETVASFGEVSGVLGLKNRYQDPILGKVLLIVSDYIIYMLLALFVLFLVSFMRQRMTLMYTLSVSLVALLISYAFLQLLPVYLPSLYNMAASTVSKTLSYNILSVKAEKYSKTYGQAGLLNDSGRFIESTTSLNLYRLDNKSMRELGTSIDFDPRSLKAGNAAMIDSNSGLYVEGDNVKINVDKLMADNPITGSYKKLDSGHVYQLQSDKHFSSVIDYYTPYYLIEDGFIKSLNNFLQLYQVPPNSVMYKGGLVKDSFVVYNFVNSQPFLSPGKYVIEDKYTTPETIKKLGEVFTEEKASDFLNLNDILSNPTPEMKQTLWFRTLQQNGYFDQDEAGKKRYSGLIEYVNLHTKKFIFDIKPEASFISDENLIKIISIQAVTLFNQRSSELGNMMYPQSLNYQELPLKDVLLQSLVRDEDRFLAEDMDVVSYLTSETNPLILLMFIVAVFFNFLIVLAIQYIVPIMYLSLGVLLIVRFVANSEMKVVIKGYLKANAVIFVCFSLQVLVHAIVQYFSPSGGVILMVLIYGFLLYVISQIVSSLVFNFTEMGNSAMNEKFKAALEKLKINNIANSLRIDTTNIRQAAKDYAGEFIPGYDRYKNDRDVDSVGSYDIPVMNPNEIRQQRNRSRQGRSGVSYTESHLTQEDYNTTNTNNRRPGKNDDYKNLSEDG